MPRTLSPELRDCLDRANPYTEYRIEISEPDVGKVLRRQDEFTQAPALVSLTPALSLSASARGGLILSPTSSALATYAGVLGSFDLNLGDTPDLRYKGLSWTLDQAFVRATLKSIVAKVQAVAFAGFFFDQSFEVQIYRITKTPGVKVTNVGSSNYQAVAFTEYSFTPLFSSAPSIKVTAAQWGVSATQTLTFDLSNFGLILENLPTRAVTPDQAGELPKYLIVVRLSGQASLGGTGHYRWLTDTATSHAVAGVGTFERVFWGRTNANTQWTEQKFADVPNCTINIEAYPAIGQGIYLIDLGAVPKAASIGRMEFQRALPPGTIATLELSTAGSGGPWTSVKHGDLVGIKQQTYHLRTTLKPDSALHATPEVIAQGIEFRIPQDVSVEAIPTLPTREISLPWPKASIPEGKLRVLRTGIRDYLDVGSVIGSTSATSRLEADIFLASRHPSVTRDKWFRLERMMVSSRLPSATSEEFTLLSYASRLKRKIPQKAETINSVHTVVSSTTGQVVVTPVLVGTTIGGNEYDGKNYYMRVRSTTATQVPVGFLATIQGSTDTTKLDFTPALPQALVAGDVIEVHSGIFATQAVSWTDYDPADAWWEVLTNLLAIPPERIGIGTLPRGGRPPKVTDIAPGDATTQAKRKITGRIAEETEGDKILDILSTIMGGVTLDIDGQIVYVQIIPLTDLAGNVTVPLPPPAAVFDARDFSAAPQTPPGIEARATIVSAKYGVPATAASPDAFASKATTAVDTDALLWLQQQDLTEYGTADVPDEIAAWLYNTTDQGLYLASVIPAGLVKAASTGLRVWPLSMTEKHPRLVPGDVIVITTDQYTDYDPSTSTPIKGPAAIRGILVRVGNEGRQLSMFVPGLRDNVQLIAGGKAGSLTGLGSLPAPPVLSASFDSSGQLIINSSGDSNTASQKIAYATGAAPTAATVRAAAPIAQQNVSGLATGAFFAPGTTVFISAFGYSGTGLESTPLAVISVTNAVGAPKAPIPIINPLNTEGTSSTWDIQFNATPGSGGGGANLTYVIKSKFGTANEITESSGNATAFPLTLAIARDVQYDKLSRFILTDTATGLSVSAPFVVAARHDEDTTVGGILLHKRIVNFDSPAGSYAVAGSTNDGLTAHSSVKENGGKLITRQLAKTLSSDPDTLDGVVDGTTYSRPLATRVNAGRPVIDFTEAIHTGKTQDNIADTATRFAAVEASANHTETRTSADTAAVAGTAAATVQSGAARGQGGFSNSSGALVSGATESGGKAVNRFLGKTLAADPDSLDGTPDGTTYKRLVSVDGSGQATPTSLSTRFSCFVNRVSNQSVGNGTATFINWDTELWDDGALHDTVTLNSRITVPSGGNVGIWRIDTIIQFTASATGQRTVEIWKNGSVKLAVITVNATAAGVLVLPLSVIDRAPAVGTFYEVKVTQNSGGALNCAGTDSWFSATHHW